ncbi:hypothetical protein HQQ80_11870 [Microbacteriaceae bacterium VKM Ac-2855]|nr:hypothetical protein [Microbacteriaceae bacterium VKM Ac-2855]
MRFLRIPIAAALALALSLSFSLSGCVGQARERPDPTATPTWASPFASNKEALAAAVAAFQRYVDVSNEVGMAGFVDVNRIEGVASGSAAEVAISDGNSLNQRGIKQSGPTTIHSPLFSSGELRADGRTEVHAYICADISQSRLIDPAGVDVTPRDRADQLDYSLSFVADTPGGSNLVVERSELWSSNERCSAAY